MLYQVSLIILINTVIKTSFWNMYLQIIVGG